MLSSLRVIAKLKATVEWSDNVTEHSRHLLVIFQGLPNVFFFIMTLFCHHLIGVQSLNSAFRSKDLERNSAVLSIKV